MTYVPRHGGVTRERRKNIRDEGKISYTQEREPEALVSPEVRI
jgi:hypothetical protein